MLLTADPASQTFIKETLVNGQSARLNCIDINGQTYSIAEGLANVISLEDEWFEDVKDPEAVIQRCQRKLAPRPDIFTWWQRLPQTEPRYSYHHEWESLAALPVSTYDHWFTKQVKGTTRNMIRKSQKAGVQVRECSYDDDFVRGMTEVLNETPVRQGRAFWHYGKDFETVKRQFSRFLFREDLIGAYCGGELAGFVMLGNAGNYGLLGQFLSMIKHRDKAINNALIAHSVRVCERRKLPFLVYGYWGASSLGDFKHNSGFSEIKVPRYFVPLTSKGRLAVQFRLHRGWKAALPGPVRKQFKELRRLWFSVRSR